jgi:hypothetical protein
MVAACGRATGRGETAAEPETSTTALPGAVWKRIVVGVGRLRAQPVGAAPAKKPAPTVLIFWRLRPGRLRRRRSIPRSADSMGGRCQSGRARQGHARARCTGGIQADPPSHLKTQISEGNAAKVLIDLSREADLLVIGSRGHGGFTGLLLGSVSQHVSAHSACSVIIVRQRGSHADSSSVSSSFARETSWICIVFALSIDMPLAVTAARGRQRSPHRFDGGSLAGKDCLPHSSTMSSMMLAGSATGRSEVTGLVARSPVRPAVLAG